MLSIVNMVYMSRKEPFDDQHPKRVFIIHSENVSAKVVIFITYLFLYHQITTGAFHLNMAAADGSPKFDSLVTELLDEFGHKHLEDAFELNPVFMSKSC